MVVAGLICICGAVWGMDEAILTPTDGTAIAAEDQEFNSAMAVWYKHNYKDGEKRLREFSKKHPHSRWRAEADLHVGCYLTFKGQYGEAKQIFRALAKEFSNTNIREKATARLGNVAEREGKYDDAIGYYSSILRMNPTWDQFKYANYRGRKLLMTRRALVAKINCGPVALAACLDALGKSAEAATARAIQGTPDGISLYALAEQAARFGVSAQTVELPFADLKSTNLPVLAHVQPNHYVAVLAVNGDKAQIEDSIGGKREMPLKDLEAEWSGKAITFAESPNLAVLPAAEAMAIAGGCCGNADEDECQGCPGDCAQGSSGGGRGRGDGCGFGEGDTPQWIDMYRPNCVDEITRDLGGGSGGGSGGNGGSDCSDCSAGRPTWKVNTVNLNILVSDTPIWYNTGKGYSIAFALNYSNENSNTGIFGRGWHCVYDMKVFFLPESDLQVHRDTGRVETYEFDSSGSAYAPRDGYENYGYRDDIKVLDSAGAVAESREGSTVATGSVRVTRRGGGKYFFMPASAGETVQGRIYIIEDQVGNRVTCGYTNGALSTVTDANGGATNITTDGSGINERVTYVQIPKYEDGDWVENDRHAEFHYTDGNLTYIEDMLGQTSTLSYNALLPAIGAQQFTASTTTTQAVTTTDPATSNGTLNVDSTSGFLPSGKIKVNNNEEMSYTSLTASTFTGIARTNPVAADSGSPVAQVVPETDLSNDITSTSPGTGGQLDVVSTSGFPSSGYIAVVGVNGTEAINYTGKTETAFTGITRGNPAYAAAAATSSIWLCKQTPYLSEIVTPAKKTQFGYNWVGNAFTGDFIGLHEVRECGPTETYPSQATIHYDWTSYHTHETKYGDLTRTYDFGAGLDDAARFTVDELGNTIVQYGYNDTRDRTTVTDADGHTTQYAYNQNKSTVYGDGNHDMYFRTDPLTNQWAYTYYTDHSLHTETDAYAVTLKTYSYNSAGQVTGIAMPLNIQVIYGYDTAGRMTSSTDGRGKTTSYHYDEDGTSRGFLTSVHDPDGKATLYDYDERGRRAQVTDPSNNVTRYIYDDLDRVTKTIFGANQNDPYTETMYTCCHKVYDQDENGRRTYYVYDAKTRPYKTIKSAISTTLGTNITTSDPETGGHLAVASLAGLPTNGGRVVVLDEIIAYTGVDTEYNWLTGITRGYDGTRKVAVSYGFAVGRVDTVPATYGYHPQYLDWMVSLTDALGHTTYYEYYLNGKPMTIRYPDNTGERYTYNNSNSGNNLITKEYGTFTGTYPNQTFTPNNDLTVHYQYDANDRLLRSYH